jgi:hypothetical protein
MRRGSCNYLSGVLSLAGGIHSRWNGRRRALCPTAVSLLAVPDLSGSAARAAPGAVVALLGLFDELNELVVRALEQLK